MPTSHEPGLTKVTLIDTAGDALSTTGGKLDVNAVLAAGGTVTADQGDPNTDATKAWGVQLSTGVAFYNAPTSAQLPSTIGQKTAALSLGTAFASDQVGTAGAPSSTVLSVQGVGGGTSLPVSSTLHAGAKGATTAADVTSTAEGADHQAVDVQLYHSGTAIDPRSVRALTASDVVSAEITKWIGSTAPTVGQKTAANGIPVTLASDQTGTAGAPSTTVVSVQGVGGGTSLPISGTVTANIGTSGSLALDATLAKLTITQGTALGANTQALAGGSVTTSAPSYTTGQISPLSLTTAGELRVREAVAPSAAGITSVTAVIVSTTIAASNASRKGLNVHNNSTAGLYLRYSSSAAAATIGNYTVYLAAGAYWEMPRTGPFVEYTGELTGIWTAANGGASVTEIT